MITRVGKRFAGNWWGEVHSIFSQAVNLCIRAPGGKTVLTLLRGEKNMGERCLALRKDAADRLFGRFEHGMIIYCEDSSLHFPELDIAPLCFAGHANFTWRSPPPPARTGGAHVGYQIVRNELRRRDCELDKLPLHREARSRFDRFLEDVSGNGLPDPELLAPVVGAGPGLTPSGDDFLLGFCCALHGLRHPLLGCMKKVLSPLLSNTTLVSGVLLSDALDGCFQLPLARLRQALMCDAESSRLGEALTQAISVGASSGCDGAWGLLSGLQLPDGLNFESTDERLRALT